MYLTILLVSNPVLAANNRGEGGDNHQTLQQITTPTGTRTVLSGAAIKRAIRDAMIANGANLWRRNDTSDPVGNPAGYIYGTNNSPSMAKATPPTPAGYADDQFGFMRAEKGKGEQIAKKKGAFEASVAISTSNYEGDIAFNQGLKVAEAQLNPYTSDRHFTRYQFTVTWDLAQVDAESFAHTVQALRCLAVGGSHSSNATEITPDRILWCLHKTPGRAGLQVGIGDVFPPDEEVNLMSVYTRAKEIGVGEIFVGVRGLAFDEIVAKATPFCRKSA